MGNMRRSVVIVGAGPRGLSVLERIVSHAARRAKDMVFKIVVVDPYDPGSGQVWQAQQSRLFVMNTPSVYPTVVPTDEPDLVDSVVSGVSFDAWRKKLADSAISRYGVVTVDDERELGDINGTEEAAGQRYPSRALYGAYLRWVYQAVMSRLPVNVSVAHCRARAVRVVVGGVAQRNWFQVVVEDVVKNRQEVLNADRVVLAMGHVPVEFSAQQYDFLSFSGDDYWQEFDGQGRKKLQYFPPVVPSVSRWDSIPGGEMVLVRGLGLNFFDLMVYVTQGRGGRFVERAGVGLVYEASSREPSLVVGSGRGVPYRVKPVVVSEYGEDEVMLRCFSYEKVREAYRNGGGLSFDRDVWPRLFHDMQWNYYTALARMAPEAFVGDVDKFLRLFKLSFAEHGQCGGVSEGLFQGDVGFLVRQNVQRQWWLDVVGFSDPFKGQYFASVEDFNAEVACFITEDIRRAFVGVGDPMGVVVEVFRLGWAVLKTIMDEGGMGEQGHVSELFRWFESSVKFLVGGPPVFRMQQLEALVRAGLVSFIGPDAEFGVSFEGFAAASAQVEGSRWRSGVLVEAMSPPSWVAVTGDELLRGLMDDGVVSVKTVGDDFGGVWLSGVNVSPRPYQVVDQGGEVVSGLYVVGMQLSGAQLGVAVAAEANPRVPRGNPSGSHFLYDSDAVAKDIVRRWEVVQGE